MDRATARAAIREIVAAHGVRDTLILIWSILHEQGRSDAPPVRIIDNAIDTLDAAERARQDRTCGR